jgi:hypothetical protein
MGIFRKLNPVGGTNLPKGILKVGEYYQVEGRYSLHVNLEQALKQLEGMKHAT